MHVAKLTMRGFKSFASATTMILEPGITAVVGPNGSGKSNVVDALAWVMGEQGARTLRGGKMEDVIFAGTAGRPALGRAEVAMTIDNHDGALPIDYSEVTISRTLFRAGGSEYAINGTPCRLLDVQELLSDAGIGSQMHVIVGQGQLDEVLRATPEQRRGLIEEAAGVLKHRKRKEKALRKLDAMEASLVRLRDLAGEVRRQLGPLGRQAASARKAARWQAQLRDARLRLLADDLATAESAHARDLAAQAGARARIARAEEELAALARQLDAAGEKAAAAAEQADRAAQAVLELTGLRDSFASTARVAAERARSLTAAAAALRDQPGPDPDGLRDQARQLREQEAGLRSQEAALGAALAGAQARRQAAEEAAAAARARAGAIAAAAADRREGLARLSGQIAARQSRIEAVEAELARHQDDLERHEAAAAAAQARFVVVEASLTAREAGESGLDAALTRCEEQLGAARQALAEAGERAREAQAERDRARARREALSLALRGRGGAAILTGPQAPPSAGPLAGRIGIAPGYEAQIAAALGPAADAVTYDSTRQARDGLAYLRATDAGRGALIVADPAEPVPADTALERVRLPRGARPAAGVITAPGQLGEVLRALLSRTVLVTGDDQAREVLAAGTGAGIGLTAVTPDAEVFRPGLVHAGDAEHSTIELRAACEHAAEDEQAAAALLEAGQSEAARAGEQVSAAASRRDDALARLHASDADLSALADELATLRGRERDAGAAAGRARAAIKAASEQLSQDRADLEALSARFAAAQAAAPEETGPEADLPALDAAAADARAAETTALLELRTAQERVRAISGRAERLDAEAAAAGQARARARTQAAALRERLELAELIGQVAARAETRMAAAAGDATRLRAQAQEQRTATGQDVLDLRAAAEDRTQELRQLTDAAHREEVARAGLRARLEALRSRAADEFGITAEELLAGYGPGQPVPGFTDSGPAPAGDQGGAGAARRDGEDGEIPVGPGGTDATGPGRPFVRAEQEELAAALEKRLARLGRINPLALEEYEALEERHAFLTSQIEDLCAGRRDLLGIVKDVDDRVQAAFAGAFADTAREFESVFARLFPGGRGRLTLTGDDMLTAGIEVEARPPGKRVKRLSLLSGGERSLTALALLVAVFKARPSPFYVMDEVEAALDDANLTRLLGLLGELRENSQLIVITHQKRTMQTADALYGVSMRPDGATTMVSQRLREVASA